MGVGYFQGCRLLGAEPNPLRFLETNPRNSIPFLEILSAEVGPVSKAGDSHSGGEV